jgi:TPR repeat protein
MYNGEGVSIDFQGAAHCYKFSVDQGNAGAQKKYGRG